MSTTTRLRPHPSGEQPAAAVKELRAAARARDLVDLMERRPDLAGVYLPADLAVEALRWSV